MRRGPCLSATMALATCVVLAGCASATFAPTEVTPVGMPYESLNENSYGARSTSQFRFCDPQDDFANNPNLSPEARAKVGEFAAGVATSIGSVVGAPLQGMTKIDSKLVGLGLAGQFKAPSDSNHPLVAVLSNTEDSIVFWHSAKYVRPREIAAAAQSYCAKRQRTVLNRGAASRCPPVERGLGGMPIANTYAISAFACKAN